MTTFALETNPLIARKNRARALRLGGIAAAALFGATLLLSAGVSAEPEAPAVIAAQSPVEPAAASSAAPAARQVRIIPIWKVSKDQSAQ
jgi:hypothetical protein